MVGEENPVYYQVVNDCIAEKRLNLFGHTLRFIKNSLQT
jgi:hypothetical protein